MLRFIPSPEYSGKQMVNGDRKIFSSNKSFLFRNRIIDVSTNHFELQIESNNFIDSIIRFISSSSANTKSYPERATQKMMAVTPSKQCIHFLRSDRWPPTSNILHMIQQMIYRTIIYMGHRVPIPVCSLEMQSFETEMRLDNASRFDSGAKNILLRWHIFVVRYSI